MSSYGFAEPPTQATLADARRLLQQQRGAASDLAAQIRAAEDDLARIVRARRVTILELEKELEGVEQQVSRTLAYISHIRRLPQELLGYIFMFIFDDYPCCAWVLAAVCSMWRRQVLSMPKLWSKIRLVTTSTSSPDTVRLWLERSGISTPLDIEIYLRTQSPPREASVTQSRSSTATLSTANGWEWMDNEPPASTPDAVDEPDHDGGPAFIHIATHAQPHFVPVTAIPNSPPIHHHHVHTGPTPIYHEIVPVSSWHRAYSRTTTGMHWGYIAFYYLIQQMHRWERFVFRFDRQFPSINALKVMTGDAPLLREFEVSGGDPITSVTDWTWLPCAQANSKPNLQKLTKLTLQYVPFKWSSPMFTGLQSLCLRTVPQYTIALDRIVYIIKCNPRLEELALNIASATPAVLPMTQTTLEHVKSFSIGGHYLLGALLDCLALPTLEKLIVDIEARDPIEDMLTQLILRSDHPPITRLSLCYTTQSSPLYYHAGSGITSWQFLSDLEELQTLHVGGAPFEPLVAILGLPEDDNQDQWYCPRLVSFAMKACRPSHSEGVAKLVQMIEARNPDTGAMPMAVAGVTPERMRRLELHDCATLGLDVVRWLQGRIHEVVCTEPTYDSAGLNSPLQTYQYV
ncbi:hypothetical protein PHLGIDRAFT_84540 [Phlebiopsis gigantea 11061_1 CR5-6]|uniref:Uncharacterized protein n=1 Tax=Phlebiopsis gigantea (strain 11061_1 CR5-6) TaxID=745531 RepID=A0A0C3SES2_PHLG1|nr:hypothetical protein PHLGIDRAFT_84540 [Phlebiopsis gigantea 11061_1 CR5-6]